LIEQLQNGDAEPLVLALPIAVGLGGLQLLHEVAHLVAALRSNVKIGFPVAVPSLQLGLYGCVTRFFSFPPSRSALFDVAAAGPVVAGVASLAVYVVGLILSFDLPPLPAAPGDLYPVLPTALLQSSLLLGTMAEAILPDLSNSQIVQLHPLAVIGFTGTLLNALQLLPVGRLDGGRLATAALGQGAAGIVSGIGLLLLGLQSILSGDNPILLYFGLFVIFFQRAPDLPVANEYTGLGLTRQIAAVSAFLFMLLTLLPCPVELVYPAVPM
jgi:membrane-associated protease RseP (regulator of RpoE activity)